MSNVLVYLFIIIIIVVVKTCVSLPAEPGTNQTPAYIRRSSHLEIIKGTEKCRPSSSNSRKFYSLTTKRQR